MFDNILETCHLKEKCILVDSSRNQQLVPDWDQFLKKSFLLCHTYYIYTWNNRQGKKRDEHKSW